MWRNRSPLNQAQSEPLPPPGRLMVLRGRLSRAYVRWRSLVFILVAAAVAFTAGLAYDSTRPPPQRLTQRDIDLAVERTLDAMKPKPAIASVVYETIRPSVVRIVARITKDGEKKDGDNDRAVGTGVIINENGLIITNLHVVRDATEIIVTFPDGSESAASIMDQQPENDLAVLRPEIIPDDLVAAVLAGSGGLRVGDEVVAVGHPFGITNSVSAGVVSGLQRNFRSPKTGQTLENLIQFDAAVNPGNSGGPLLNRDGEVVGIVTALLNPTDMDVFIGIGFAVTMETAGGLGGAPPL